MNWEIMFQEKPTFEEHTMFCGIMPQIPFIDQLPFFHGRTCFFTGEWPNFNERMVEFSKVYGKLIYVSAGEFGETKMAFLNGYYAPEVVQKYPLIIDGKVYMETEITYTFPDKAINVNRHGIELPPPNITQPCHKCGAPVEKKFSHRFLKTTCRDCFGGPMEKKNE